MAFAAARMILKDKRRKASKEDFRDPRNRSKARNKPADGGGHVNQKNVAGQKATPPCQKGASTKGGPKTPVKPSAQKGAAKTAPPKQAAAAAVKTPQGKKKKGHKHQQYELIVTINLMAPVVKSFGEGKAR
ncbi:hypothetical protein RR48_04105 [Papilio machaon]|uniref:Uncharacterized protein n=1 Tax=Papilio machaon TaxID=76193 RepID=A0A0N0PEG5_PAPMA|nr:hypothetical protein RR48_04105 [Papilio machaon]